MLIVNCDSIEPFACSGEIVNKGSIFGKTLIDARNMGGFGVGLGDFRPGSRFNFHVHSSEQILYVTDGTGIVATKEKEYKVTKGNIIYIEPGEIHWHGATSDCSFSHINIQRAGFRLVA